MAQARLAGQVEMLAVGLVADGQQAGLAEHAVGIGDVIDGRDGVFAGHEPEQFVAVGLAHPAASRPSTFVQARPRRLSAAALSGPVRWAA